MTHEELRGKLESFSFHFHTSSGGGVKLRSPGLCTFATELYRQPISGILTIKKLCWVVSKISDVRMERCLRG